MVILFWILSALFKIPSIASPLSLVTTLSLKSKSESSLTSQSSSLFWPFPISKMVELNTTKMKTWIFSHWSFPFNPFNPFPLPNGSYVQHHHQTNHSSTFSRHHPLPKAFFLVRPSNSSTRLTSFFSFSCAYSPLKSVLTERLMITVLAQKSSFLEFPWS